MPKTLEEAALKPCPFCGGEAELTSVSELIEYRFVMCKACGAGCDNADTLPEADCVDAWNKRAALATDEGAVRVPLLEWAVSRWRTEVENRPMVNVHRRTLDNVWRQVIRYAGGDPDALVGPSHDAMLAAHEKERDDGH